MRVYILQPIGDSIASKPSNSNSLGYRVLSYIRRHGNQVSDQQLKDHLVGVSGSQLRRTMDELERNQAVRCVVNN